MLSGELKKRIEELLRRHARQDTLLATGFLTPAERADVAAWLHDEPSIRFCGGYASAERCVLLLLPSWQEEADAQQETLGALRLHAPFSRSLTHRDYLGALLGLGVERACIGDILVREDGADVIALAHMATFLQQSLLAVGRFAVHAEPLALDALAPVQQRALQVRSTVPQLRLDCVAAAAFSLSRSRMGELIDQGAVQLQYEVCYKRERLVREGDAISVRGMGKAVVAAIGGHSRKDRIWIEIERLQ